MKKIFLCLGNVFFLFFVFLFLVNHNVIAQHACNQPCSGAANITCNETTGTINSNRGSCNSGLACYSGAGNVCRNPYCPNRTDCNCPNFTIQGYKQPNQSPFSTQTVYLDGGSGTTAQPYFFTNVPANSIHRVNVSAPSGSAVGYTLCYDSIGCHNVTPTPGSQVYICSNRLTSYADLWWHYTPQTANVSNISGPTTVFAGDTVTYQANYSNDVANLTDARMYAYQNTCLGTPLIRNESFSGPGTYSFNWTPTATGNYVIYGRADAATAYCIGYNTCVGSPPNYSCKGPNTSLNVTVSNPGPWYKLKNASLNKIGNHDIAVVQNVQPFDSEDNTQRFVIITSTGSDPGILISQGNYDPGPSYNKITASSKNWYIGGYVVFNKNLLSNFSSYIRSRKNYKNFVNLSDIDNNGDGIYLYSGTTNLNINTNINYHVVIVVENYNVTINLDSFNLSGTNLLKNIAIIVSGTGKKIIFSSNVTKAGGIFIADTVEYQSTNGLKIKGNLIANNQLTLQPRSDNRYPSLFVVFDPTVYLGLLDKLSISKYDWKQLQ